MARKSAAQIAQEELEAAKQAEALKQLQGNEGGLEDGTGGDDGTGAGGDDGTGGDGTGEGGDLIPEGPAVEIDKINAVALRDLPGTPAKHGQIILAPKNLIDSWEQYSWVDTHENALKFALQARVVKLHELKARQLADPSVLINVDSIIGPEEMELDYMGQLVVKVLEE